MDILLYIIAGAVVGLAVGITGVGGGSIMTPILILFGFPYNVAIGTDLLYAAITKTGGMIAHSRQKSVEWPIVLKLAAGSIPGSIITTLLLDTFFTAAEDYGPILTTTLGIMLIATSLVIIYKLFFRPKHPQLEGKTLTSTTSFTVILGFILGIVVTLSSVGAGAICAALLLVLYPHLPALRIVGTDISHAVPLTFIAGLGHFLFLGNVDFYLLGCLLIGSLPAITIGTHLGAKLPNTLLQPILAAILMVLGIKFTVF